MREELSEKYVLSKKRNWPKMESQGITFQGCTGKPTKKTGGKKKKRSKICKQGGRGPEEPFSTKAEQWRISVINVHGYFF